MAGSASPLRGCVVGSSGTPTRVRAFSEKGYFSQVDPDAVGRPLRKRKTVNIAKREGFSDFIWNIDWQTQLAQEDEIKRTEKEAKEKKTEKPSGFLSLARAADLNDLSIDLSAQLQPKPAPKSVTTSTSKTSATYVPPTQKATLQWARSDKFATRAIAPDLDAEGLSIVEADIQSYNQENSEILLWNAALIGVSFSATYVFYTQDVAFSYLAGAFGGLLYLRLLRKGVEGLSSGGIGSLAAQPRLLVPVILVMAFNRWNALAGDQVGVHLELLPMLVGFFTYKAAVVGRQSVALFQTMLSDMKQEKQK